MNKSNEVFFVETSSTNTSMTWKCIIKNKNGPLVVAADQRVPGQHHVHTTAEPSRGPGPGPKHEGDRGRPGFAAESRRRTAWRYQPLGRRSRGKGFGSRRLQVGLFQWNTRPSIADVLSQTHMERKCRSEQIFGVRRIFVRFSTNLPEKIMCEFSIQICPHKDHENHFLVWPP